MSILGYGYAQNERKSESQKIEDLPVFATCRSGTSVMLAIFFGAIPTYGILPYTMIVYIIIHEALAALLTTVTYHAPISTPTGILSRHSESLYMRIW